MIKCPNCETPLEITPQFMGEQMLTLSLTWEGEMMQAKTIAGSIDNTRKLLEATAKEMGCKASVFVHSIKQEGKQIDVAFLVTTEQKP